jgi:hypothetical protein
VNDIIQPQTIVKTNDDSASSSWRNEEIFEIHIPTRRKTEPAKQHEEQHRSTLHHKKQLGLYTDGSLLAGRAGAGVFASGAGQAVHESQHYLAKEMEVFNAEVYGIAKATDVAMELVKEEETTDV